MARGLWQRLRGAFWSRFNWWLDKQPPDEAAMRKQAGQAAKQRLRDRTSRAIALADAAHGELEREVARHQQMLKEARGLIGPNEGGARLILSQLIDAETRISSLASRYRLLRQEAERHGTTWLVVREAEDPASIIQMEELSPPSEAELLAQSGVDRELFDAGVLSALAEITVEIRQAQVEDALSRLKSSPGDLSGFTVTDVVNLRDINELIAQPRFQGVNLGK